jgi:hypothetical protein
VLDLHTYAFRPSPQWKASEKIYEKCFENANLTLTSLENCLRVSNTCEGELGISVLPHGWHRTGYSMGLDRVALAAARVSTSLVGTFTTGVH